jgi:transcriptional regulator with XRE-family HTH domain
MKARRRLDLHHSVQYLSPVNPRQVEEETEVGRRRPTPGLTHRMALALEVSGVSVNQMADELEVSRQTVSGWLHHRSRPSVASLKLWAQVTGVDEDWLREDPKVVGEVVKAQKSRTQTQRTQTRKPHARFFRPETPPDQEIIESYRQNHSYRWRMCKATLSTTVPQLSLAA